MRGSANAWNSPSGRIRGPANEGRRVTRATGLLLALACAVTLTACGGGKTTSSDATAARAPAPPSGPTGSTGTTAPSGATPPATGPVPAPASTTGSSAATTTAKPPEHPKGAGAGDEKPIRQPVRFEVGGANVTPSSASVAPFLAIELELVNKGSTAVLVRLIGTDTIVQLAPGATATKQIAGLKQGLYTLSVNDGAQVGSIVVGGNVGP
jgi:hypothetical protein